VHCNIYEEVECKDQPELATEAEIFLTAQPGNAKL
jgi:hypothetical protein